MPDLCKNNISNTNLVFFPMKDFFIKIKNKLSEAYIKIGQLIYLTIEGITENNLFESVNSCAFGFIFSFIPIILIIMAVLSGVLNAYPSLLNYVLTWVEELKPIIDITGLLNQLMTMKSFSWFELFLGIWVIWMARKLFISVLSAITKIFRTVNPRKNWFNQIFVFILELVLILSALVVVMAIFIMNKAFSLPFFEELEEFLPIGLLYKISSNVSLITYIILFVFSTIIFRMASGVKPKVTNCAFFAALATITFYIVNFFIHTFINTTNYNLVYGAISSVIVLMMQVWFFFFIFLFFAQMLFAAEYREVLALGVLYMMPEKEEDEKDPFWRHVKRNLFRHNPVKITKYETISYNTGDIIFDIGDAPDSVFYIRSGSVHRHSAQSESQLSHGAFFGEMHCILNHPRTSKAVALESCVITKIKSDEFLQMLHTNPKASAKAIAKVSKYTAELYRLSADEDPVKNEEE